MFYVNPGDVQILGISGQIANGKTTLTKLAVEAGFTPYALARHFKVDAVAKAGMSPLAVFGAAEFKTDESRHTLQQLGTEQGRKVYGEDVWLKHAEAHIYDLIEHGVTHVVISDVRFENEVRWVQSLGGLVYRVYGRQPVVTEGHASETALNGWAHTSPDGGRGFDRLIYNGLAHGSRALTEFKSLLAVDYPDARVFRRAA